MHGKNSAGTFENTSGSDLTLAEKSSTNHRMVLTANAVEVEKNAAKAKKMTVKHLLTGLLFALAAILLGNSRTCAADGLIWFSNTHEGLAGKSFRSIETAPDGTVYTLARNSNPDTALWAYNPGDGEWSAVSAWGEADGSTSSRSNLQICARGYIHAATNGGYTATVFDPATGDYAVGDQSIGWSLREPRGLWVDPSTGTWLTASSNNRAHVVRTDGGLDSIIVGDTFDIRDRTEDYSNSQNLSGVHGTCLDNVWITGTSQTSYRADGPPNPDEFADSFRSYNHGRFTHSAGRTIFVLDAENAIRGTTSRDNRLKHDQWDGEEFSTSFLDDKGPSPDDVNHNCIYAESLDSIWVVGDGGLAAYWNGEQWSKLGLGTEEDLYWVSRGTNGAMWISGDDGRVFIGLPEKLKRTDPVPTKVQGDENSGFPQRQAVIFTAEPDIGEHEISVLLDIIKDTGETEVVRARALNLAEKVDEVRIALLDDDTAVEALARIVKNNRLGLGLRKAAMQVYPEPERLVSDLAEPAKDIEEASSIRRKSVEVMMAGGSTALDEMAADQDLTEALLETVYYASGKLRSTAFTALRAIDYELPDGLIDWPMWGYDATRGGRTPLALPDELHLQWKRELPPSRRAWRPQMDDRDKLEFDLSYSPVVKGRKIFVPSMVNDSLTAYDVETGEELWRYYADGPVRLAPAAWEGRVYFVSDDGHLYCLDTETGKLQWRFKAAPAGHRVLGNERVVSMWPARGGPVIKDGTVYFAAGIWPFLGTLVFALDANSGAVQWANTGHATEWQRQPHSQAFSFAGVAPQGYLAVSGDRLVVSGGRALPALFDREDGTLLHSTVTGKYVGGYRVQIKGEHYYNHGQRYRLEDGGGAGSGSLKNEVLRASVEAVKDKLDGEVFEYLAAQNRLFVTTVSGRLYCFGADPSSRPRKYTRQLETPRPASSQAGAKAADILNRTGVDEGYALVCGIDDGELLEQLAVRSKLHIVALEPEVDKAEKLRRRLDRAGLYGHRVSVIADHLINAHYPPYIFSLIVVAEPGKASVSPDDATLKHIYTMLRPYGGQAYFVFNDDDAIQLKSSNFAPECGSLIIGEDHVRLQRSDRIPGTADWTHQYADAGNTTFSPDKKVRPPFGISWFGGPSNDNILPRHGQGPVPHVAEGRIILTGVETVSARCVYTGRELWEREFPGIGHPFTDLEFEESWRQGDYVHMARRVGIGASFIGSFLVSLPDSIYIRYQGKIIQLDPKTGNTISRFTIYDSDEPDDFSGGHISVSKDVILVTAGPQIFDDDAIGVIGSLNATSSRRLLALDRNDGSLLWSRDAETGFRHNAIASGGERVFVIDSITENAFQKLARRGKTMAEKPLLLALDLHTGEVKWQVSEGIFGTWLGYSEIHDVLVQSGRRGGTRHPPGEPGGKITVYQGRDGDVLWQQQSTHWHLALAGDRIITGRPAYGAQHVGWTRNLLTGEKETIEHPVTGKEQEWRYWRDYGCNTLNTSTHLMLFRSGSAAFAELSGTAGTGTLGGFRAGCTNNMIPANGILSVPDYTRTCACSYQNQTSLGLVHMPEMEMWTANRPLRQIDKPIKRLGINLGAPGDRMAEDGTLWTPFPYPVTVGHRDAPNPELNVLVQTVDYEPAAVRIIETAASSARNPERVGYTLNGDTDSAWSIRSDNSGLWDAWIEYRLNKPVSPEKVVIDWDAPEETRFEIKTSLDGKSWNSLFTGVHSGSGDTEYTLEPVPARYLRLMLYDHGKNEREHIRIRRFFIGDLPFPEAYVHFLPLQGLFRSHSLLIKGEGFDWVAASGIKGLTSLTVPNFKESNQERTVNMHFVEPDESVKPGERVFNIYIQGQLVLNDFDIAAETGSFNHALLKTFPGIAIEQELKIELIPAPDSEYPPVLCGLEVK